MCTSVYHMTYQCHGRGYVGTHADSRLGWFVGDLWVCGGTARDRLTQFLHQREILCVCVCVCVCVCEVGGEGENERDKI